MATKASFGRYYEDFQIGEVIEHWPGRTITETDNLYFSLLTMNQHPLHIDAAYASGTEFGQRVVVGPLVFSVVVGMSVADISGRAIANLSYELVEHNGPTFHGDTLYAETTVLDKRESRNKTDRGIVRVETRGRNQNSEIVLTLRRNVLVPKRGGSGAGGAS
ncbi:MAG: MaoC family dehydratase [Myxococcota bacterium]